jgi:hypothetical protein
MENRKFDDLTRSLALGKSRRTVIKGLFGGVVGTIAVAGRPAYGVLAGEPVGCGSDAQCEGDDICCEGVCAAIVCCMADEATNPRCPTGTHCFEGYCDPDEVGCGSDEQCAGDEICCEGVCAAIECCIGDADPNARCPEGTSCFEGYCDEICDIVGCNDGYCCCNDGSCAYECCESPVVVLPATGSGSASEGGAWVAAAAIGGAAAYIAARKVRTPGAETAGE